MDNFTVDCFVRKNGTEGVFWNADAKIKAESFPTKKEVIQALNKRGFEVGTIRSIKRVI